MNALRKIERELCLRLHNLPNFGLVAGDAQRPLLDRRAILNLVREVFELADASAGEERGKK